MTALFRQGLLSLKYILQRAPSLVNGKMTSGHFLGFRRRIYVGGVQLIVVGGGQLVERQIDATWSSGTVRHPKPSYQFTAQSSFNFLTIQRRSLETGTSHTGRDTIQDGFCNCPQHPEHSVSYFWPHNLHPIGMLSKLYGNFSYLAKNRLGRPCMKTNCIIVFFVFIKTSASICQTKNIVFTSSWFITRLAPCLQLPILLTSRPIT